MIAPANFKEHAFVATGDADMIKKGFHIGAKVFAAKRMSTDFLDPSKKGKTHRKNIEVGTAGVVKGYVKKGKDIENIVVYFEYDLEGGLLAQADVSIKIANLTVEPPAKEKAKVVRTGHEYVSEKSTVVEKWASTLTSANDEVTAARLKANAGFVLSNIVHACPKYTPSDLTIAKCNNGGSYEVYTHRAFKAYELKFVPDTHELKTRLWTQGRSVMTQHPINLHPDKKNTSSWMAGSGASRVVPVHSHCFSSSLRRRLSWMRTCLLSTLWSRPMCTSRCLARRNRRASHGTQLIGQCGQSW